MKTTMLAVLLTAALLPRPVLAEPGSDKPPEGAVVLFDGSDTSQWIDGKAEDGFLREGTTTRESFGDCLLHVEFNIRPREDGRQANGNSGVYIQRRYEIQILNSHGKEAWKGGCGAIYQFKAPDVNACLPLGQWQTFDIVFCQPRWNGKEKTADARFSVVHNGEKIHDNVAVSRKTGHGQPEGPQPGPLHFQNHGNKVHFANVWLLPLGPEEVERYLKKGG